MYSPPGCVTTWGTVVGLEWSKDPEGNPGGSVATDRVSNVGQVKGDDPEDI
jgi:hypothetical protein